MNLISTTPHLCWFNGTFQDENVARIPATSAAALLGWGVFTTIGVFGGKPFALPLHLARLRSDAAQTQISFAPSDTKISEALQEVIARNEVRDGVARLTLLQRADGRWNREKSSDFLIVARAHAPASTRREKKCRVVLSPHRINEFRATCGLKTTSYLDALVAWQQAQTAGFDEALLLNTREKICEGGRSNVFWARGEEVFTASSECGLLPGIGRALLLQWLRAAGKTCNKGEFGQEELLRADAMWLVSAASGVRAVAELHAFTREYSRGEKTLLRRFDLKNAIFTQLQNQWREATHAS